MKTIEIALAYNTDISPSPVHQTYGDFYTSCHISGESEYVSLLPHSGLGTVNLNIPDDSKFKFDEYELILNIKNSQRKGDWGLNISKFTTKKLKKIIIKGVSGSNCGLSSLNIFPNTVQIILEDLTIDHLRITGCTDISINTCSIINGSIYSVELMKLAFLNSDLGKCYLFNLNIENLSVQNCNINSIQISNVNIKTVITAGMKDPEIKELYRHLKYLFDQIGNKTEANKFFAKEMEFYMKVLDNDPAKKWEYRISWLQKEVSDFGQNWVRAFLLYFGLIFIGFISYETYQTLDPKLIFDFSWEGFKNGVVDFTKLANPIPKIEDINNPFSLLFSIAKILIVYQIVVALRRISQR